MKMKNEIICNNNDIIIIKCIIIIVWKNKMNKK